MLIAKLIHLFHSPCANTFWGGGGVSWDQGMSTEVPLDEFDDGIPEIEGAEGMPLVLFRFCNPVLFANRFGPRLWHTAILICHFRGQQFNPRQGWIWS